MPLINFQTDLTNLPWGRDRRDGGSSKQPYITKAIPDGLESDDLPLRSGPDFLIRNGFLAPLDALKDVSRLAQMFVDPSSPAGLLFIAKQNLLSRTANKTQASVGIGYAGPSPLYLENTATGVLMGGGGLINAGIYTPLSTLGQALGGFAGLHLNQLGLDPTSPMSGVVEGGLFPGAGLTTYESVVGQERILNESPEDGPNRLVNLKYFIDEDGSSPKVNLLSYSGGPGSILGIGKTNLRFATGARTGAANAENITLPSRFKNGGLINRSYQTQGDSTFNFFNLQNQNSVSAIYGQKYLGEVIKLQADREFIFNDSLSTGEAIKVGLNGPYQSFSFKVNGLIPEISEYIDENDETQTFTTLKFQTNTEVLYKNNSLTFDQLQLIGKDGVVQGGQSGLYPTDFRKELYDVGPNPPSTTNKSTVLSLSPSYRSKNKDVRFNMGQPGKQGGNRRGDAEVNGLGKNIWNYGINALELEALDKITAMPMYSGVGPDVKQPINDAVKFRIAAINNDGSNGEAVYMHFRAFLDDFSDSYTSTWNPVNYVGRGDSLYNYQGFGRTISLGFTVAAQSKAELIPMYKKLNYLASTLAPDYSEAGFMRGNMVRLTIGGYLYEQPGFITSLTYTVPQESSWEIAINQEGGSDSSVKELPHMIKVSGFSFTPIHTFLPQKPNNPNNPDSKFIALTNGINSNYDDEYLTYEPNGTSDGDNNSATT